MCEYVPGEDSYFNIIMIIYVINKFGLQAASTD